MEGNASSEICTVREFYKLSVALRGGGKMGLLNCHRDGNFFPPTHNMHGQTENSE